MGCILLMADANDEEENLEAQEAGSEVAWWQNLVTCQLSRLNKIQNSLGGTAASPPMFVPFGVTYEKIGTIQRRLAWPLHKDDTLSRSGRSTDLNIYFVLHLN